MLTRIQRTIVAVLLVASAAGALAAAPETAPASEPTAAPTIADKSAWKNGLSSDPNFFPIAVWLQDPKNAAKFKAIGINVYVGLWEGPTEAQLAELKKQGMKVICDQNATGLKHIDDPTIVGWMHGDEPDNAQDIKSWKSPEEIQQAWPGAPRQSLAKWGGYGPPIPPRTIEASYQRIRKADPSRPVMLNLGQGVAYDNYIGRGYRRGHMEDYPEYIKGCDIVSFDIYPVVEDAKEVAGKLEYVPRGVERLVKWSAGAKTVWNCIECTHISNPPAIALAEQIRSEVWMSIIHGSRGLIYFVHEFKPKFIEAGLLAHDEQRKAVAEINKEVQSLAAVINTPAYKTDAATATFEPGGSGAAMDRSYDGALYIFAAVMRDKPSKLKVSVVGGQQVAEVLGENRGIAIKDGKFEDDFKGYGVHLYRISKPKETKADAP